MENIQLFITACSSLGISNYETFFKMLKGMRKDDIFITIDLFEEKNIPKVINCLLLLGGIARKRGFEPLIRNITDFNEELTAEELMR
jgi:hypothetical protein